MITVFTFTEKSGFSTTSTYKLIEIFTVASIMVATGAEFIVMIASIYTEFKTCCCRKKQKNQRKKIEGRESGKGVDKGPREQLPTTADNRMMTLGENMNHKPSQIFINKIEEKRLFRREVVLKKTQNENPRILKEQVEGGSTSPKKFVSIKARKRMKIEKRRSMGELRMKEVGVPVKSKVKNRKQKIKINKERENRGRSSVKITALRH